MMKEFNRHPADYAFLAGVLVIFAVGYFTSKQYVIVQQALAVGLGISYFVWGVLHHRTTKTLTHRIMLEYFFVALLATSLLIVVNL